MAKLFSIKLDKAPIRNLSVIDMQKKYPGKRIHKDKRLKRQNKNSWKKEMW